MLTVDIERFENINLILSLDIEFLKLPQHIPRFIKNFLRGRVLVNRLHLQKVSWDLFFGAYHFCSFAIAHLADYTPKLPGKYFCVWNKLYQDCLFVSHSLNWESSISHLIKWCWLHTATNINPKGDDQSPLKY